MPGLCLVGGWTVLSDKYCQIVTSVETTTMTGKAGVNPPLTGGIKCSVRGLGIVWSSVLPRVSLC